MPKPKFDPSQPYQTVGDKPKFDPSQPFEAENTGMGSSGPSADDLIPDSRPGDAPVSAARAAVIGAENTLIPGDVPLWQRAFRATPEYMNRPSNLPPEQDAAMRAEAEKGTPPDQTLEGMRKIRADEERRAKAQHPLATIGGNVGGLAVGSLLPGAKNPLPEAAVEAAGNAADDVATAAARRAFGFSKKELDKNGLAAANKASRTALDEGVISNPFIGSRKMMQRTSAAENSAGGRLGGLREKMDAAGDQAGALELYQALEDKLATWKPGGEDEAALRPVLEKLKNEVLVFAEQGDGIPPTELARLKKSFQSADDRYGQVGIDTAPAAQRLRSDAGSVVMQRENELASQSPALSQTEKSSFLEDKRKYGDLEAVRRQLLGKANAEDASKLGGVQDLLSAGAGALLGGSQGGPEAAISAMLAPFLVRGVQRKGPQATAWAADKAAKLMQSKFAGVLADAAGRGSNALAVADYVLRRNPEYRAMVEED